VNCDGSDATILSNNQCTVTQASLQAEPFNLVKGDVVFAKVKATNLYGTSNDSPIGDGASIWLQPDTPINLANDVSVTTEATIGLTWSPGDSNGGTPIIDYKLWYALVGDEYQVLEASLTTTTYATSVTLQSGSSYKFKVQVQTLYGYSEDSNEVVIEASRIPDIPTGVTTTQLGSSVVVSWTAPYNGGS
jgi:hypothetical protein